jgi:signal peptidase I
MVAAILIALIVKAFVGQAFSIPTPSMTPTLAVGDRVVVSRLSYRLHEPNRGDIVVFVSPEDPGPTGSWPSRVLDDLLEGVGLRAPDENDLIKRVIGLPGEVVEGRDGRVFVNGREVIEPYLPEDTFTSDFEPVTVPEDHLFVMGDNREESLDSRRFGPVPVDSLVGRAVVRAWPPGRLGFL